MESELRAVGRGLEVPPASDLTAAVRQRLEGQAARRRRIRGPGTGARHRRLAWRAALVVVVAVLAGLIAVPQGRAVVTSVLRLAGVERGRRSGRVGCPSCPPESDAV
jgi:hypothetical protein